MRFLFGLLLLMFSNKVLLSQKDSTKYRVFGVESGYINYGSIDDIFIPYIYSGSSWNYGIYTRKYKSNSVQELKLDWALMTRKPVNLSVPEYYRVLTYDANKTYTVKSEDYFRECSTTILDFNYTYLRKINIHIFSKDQIMIGFINQNLFIFRKYLEDHELISLKLNPAFYYEFNINKLNKIYFHTNISLLAVNLRKPYSGATAQVSDVFDNYFSYFYRNSSIDLFTNYFNIYTRLNYEASLHRRLKLNLFYDFSYVNMREPRKLVSVTNIFGLGLQYKFGNYAKK